MARDRGFEVVVSDVVDLLEAARHAAARSVNAVLTTTYWEIGRRIVEEEQRGRSRSAEYGKGLVTRLAVELTARFGRGFSRRSLFKMRAFYLEYCDRGDLPNTQKIVPTASALSRGKIVPTALTLSSRFPLPWSHYVALLALGSREARMFYEQEALRGGWTYPQLQRQIATDFYERTMSSRGKPVKQRRYPTDAVSAEEELKDPYVLEFLGLTDDHSESEVEDGLIRQMQSFLLELGGNFAFIGRQQRMRVGDQWHRVDLLFFHRRLRCLVIIDLKLGALTGADVGQMHLYVNYARENWMLPGENPPVGLILSGKKNAAVAHYAMDGLPDNVVAAEYRTALPAEKLLVDRINRSWKLLEVSRPKESASVRARAAARKSPPPPSWPGHRISRVLATALSTAKLADRPPAPYHAGRPQASFPRETLRTIPEWCAKQVSRTGISRSQRIPFVSDLRSERDAAFVWPAGQRLEAVLAPG